MEDNKVGRKTVMTESKVKELEGYFVNGATDIQACFLAGISKQTLYNYQELNPEFVDRKVALKDDLAYRAKLKIKAEIESETKPDTAKWYLERRDKEFKQKTDVTTNDEALQPLLVKFLNDDNSTTNG